MPAFFVGINDPLGGNPHGTLFTPVIFNLFDAWTNTRQRSDHGHEDGDDMNSRRASIARGQALFNSKPIVIRGVAGLNDDLNLASIPGTCGTCHDSFNVGNHSVSAPLNIGVGDLNSPLDVSYLPVFTLENVTTHEIKMTTDPGRALITGLWKDVGRLKGPILRGLSSRAQTAAQRIVFPEGEDPRILKAARILADDGRVQGALLRPWPCPYIAIKLIGG